MEDEEYLRIKESAGEVPVGAWIRLVLRRASEPVNALRVEDVRKAEKQYYPEVEVEMSRESSGPTVGVVGVKEEVEKLDHGTVGQNVRRVAETAVQRKRGTRVESRRKEPRSINCAYPTGAGMYCPQCKQRH